MLIGSSHPRWRPCLLTNSIGSLGISSRTIDLFKEDQLELLPFLTEESPFQQMILSTDQSVEMVELNLVSNVITALWTLTQSLMLVVPTAGSTLVGMVSLILEKNAILFLETTPFAQVFADLIAANKPPQPV
jgi:hypothetical protein